MTKAIAQLCLVLASVTTATAARAANAPSQLHNKTITVSWSVGANAVAEDGRSAARSMAIQRIIYVSSKGRVFVRTARTARSASDSTDRGPDVTSGTYRFEGGRIIGFNKIFGGANQIVITFDSSFQSCSVSVQFGRQSGEDYKTKAPNGKIYTLRGPLTVSGTNCSIKEGNPFAG